MASTDLLSQQGRRKELCTELKIHRKEEIRLLKEIRLKDYIFFFLIKLFFPFLFLFEESYTLDKAWRNPCMPTIFLSSYHSKDVLIGLIQFLYFSLEIAFIK